jgi:hypothetical protein
MLSILDRDEVDKRHREHRFCKRSLATLRKSYLPGASRVKYAGKWVSAKAMALSEPSLHSPKAGQ